MNKCFIGLAALVLTYVSGCTSDLTKQTYPGVAPSEGRVKDHLLVTREVFIERGNTIDPNAIAVGVDNSVVVAGTVRPGQPWAVRLASDGTVIWRYLRTTTSDLTGFNAAIAMRDGTTLLCGTASLPEGTGRLDMAAVVTHLAPNGALISETLLYPKNDHEYFGHLSQLIQTDNGFIGVGSAFRRGEKLSLWLVFLDANGRFLFDKIVEGFGLARRGAYRRGKNVVLATYGNKDTFTDARLNTLLLRIAEDGRITAQADISGSFTFAEASDKANAIVLVNEIRPLDKEGTTIVLLDQDLHLLSKRTGNAERIYSVRTFKLPDNRILSFGSVERPVFDPGRNVSLASLALTGAGLDSGDLRSLETFDYSRTIASAARGTSPLAFVAAREVERIPKDMAGIFDPNLKSTFGVVVSYISVH